MAPARRIENQACRTIPAILIPAKPEINLKTSCEPTKQLLLTEQQAAQSLAVSPSMLYHLRKRGQIPFIQIGRAVRYELPALEQWVRTMAVSSQPSCN
jgi:excisionase family DNA binding protein